MVRAGGARIRNCTTGVTVDAEANSVCCDWREGESGMRNTIWL